MKIYFSSLLACAALALTQSLQGQGTAFTYQGRLNSGGSPATGLYDFRFRLDADPAGNTILSTAFTNAVPVTNGLFTTTLDFGPGWFNGSNYWLEVDVRTNTGSNGNYTVLNPFQPLTPTPYAIFANTASNVSGTISTAQLSGPVASANLSGTYGNAVTLNNAGNSFSGNGSGLTSLNASQLTSIGNTNGSAFGNFFVGPSGNSTTSGVNNTATGSQALIAITSGSANTAFGVSAFGSKQTGFDGTAIGAGALEFEVTNFANTGIGAGALGHLGFFGAAGGSSNIALGYEAGGSINTGSSNIDIGNAGVDNDNNIIRIGSTQTQTYLAGVINGNGGGLTSLNVSASQLTSIGNNTNGTVFGNFFVGPSGNSTVSGVNNTATGSQALIAITSGSANAAFGVSALGANSTGSENTAMGAGAIEFDPTGFANTGIGAGAIGHLGFFGAAGGSNNIALGYLAGTSLNSGSFNIEIGNAGIDGENNIIRIGTPGVQTNTFIAGVINGNGGGLTNLNAAQLTGSSNFNVFIGPSGNLIASGSQNTANGNGALHVLTTGSENTADGEDALLANTTGSENTATGDHALSLTGSGSQNTADGDQALDNNRDGSQNTAIGYQALSEPTSGTNNIAVGYQAGITVGFMASNNIDIGNAGVPGDNNIIRIGTSGIQTNAFIAGTINGNGGGLTNLNAAQLNGSVPTGVSLPAANLTGALPAISGASLTSLPAGNLTGALPALSGASLTSLNASAIASGTIPLARLPVLSLVNVSGALPASTSYTVSGNTTGGINSAVALVINNNTSGSDAPALRVIGSGGENSGALSVSSQNPQLTGLIAQFGNSNAFVVSITNDGTIYCKATVLSSDRNVKQNFQALDVRSVLDKLAAMPVMEWNYKDDATDKKHIGPMAQDFQAAFGLNGGDDKHISTVDEGGVALAAIQGLNQKLSEKDARIQEQGDEIVELKTRLEKLEQLMTEKIGGAK